MTTLHLASWCSSAPVVRLIVDASAGSVDINACNSENLTPLHYAAAHNDDVSVVQILLSKGADVKAKAQSTPSLHKHVTNRLPPSRNGWYCW